MLARTCLGLPWGSSLGSLDLLFMPIEPTYITSEAIWLAADRFKVWSYCLLRDSVGLDLEKPMTTESIQP